MFLSLLPLSCMVVPNRELVNTLFFFILNSQNGLQGQTNIRSYQINIEVDIPRGWLIISNPNRSRESSIDLNALSMAYTNRIQVLANYPI